MKRLTWIILGLLLCGVLITGFVFRRQVIGLLRPTVNGIDNGDTTSASDVDASASNQVIKTLGRLEPASGVINISATPGDQLLELFVEEGDQIDTQMVLGRLQSNVLRENEVEQLTTQLQEANQKLESERIAAKNKLESAKLAEEQAQAVSQRELEAQRAKLQSLELAVLQAGKELERLSTLKTEAPDLVSDQQLDQAQVAQQRAHLDLEAAKAALESAQIAGDFQLRLATQQREAAQLALEQVDKSAPIGSLQQRLEASKQQLERSKLRSPMGGTVLKIFTRPGETIAQRPILQVADLGRMVCIAEVSDDQLHQIRPGLRARIKSRAFRGNNEQAYLTGSVASKSLVAGTPELRQIDPFAAADRHVVEVRIELNEDSSRIAAGFVHLQVDVEFLMPNAPESP